MDTSKSFSKRLLNAFTNGLFDLLKEKDLENITVAELCGKVNYPRSTFYNYFEDIYVLMDYCWYAIGNQIKITNFREIEHDKRTISLFNMVYEYMAENRISIDKLLKHNHHTVHRNHTHPYGNLQSPETTVADKSGFFPKEFSIGAPAFPDNRSLPFPYAQFLRKSGFRNRVFFYGKVRNFIRKKREKAQCLNRFLQIFFCVNCKIKPAHSFRNRPCPDAGRSLRSIPSRLLLPYPRL